MNLKYKLDKIFKKKKERALRMLYVFEMIYVSKKYYPSGIFKEFQKEFDLYWDEFKREIEYVGNTIKCTTSLYAVKYWAFKLNEWEKEIRPEKEYDILLFLPPKQMAFRESDY